MTRNEPKSPILFNEKSSGSLSSVNSVMSSPVQVEKLATPNFNALFAKINKESAIKTEHSITDSMATFLKWTKDHKNKIKK